ncbi:hypothetical protein FZC78_11665 [Rossellomorea vietnamensis]|uniref:Uncharacterized protein n=1 Tax=Rossellomorea vietnamensis TaxID=218284 RepID=A0A5D4NRX2_9BACI|nr:hypothetical protein [Rossellomorea vietnamensis]TYS16640.1 hypothetical protein FZC78_11665 [Rossellomorea vietnamensis]
MKYAVSVTDTSRINEIEKSGQELLKKLAEFAVSLKAICSFHMPRGIVFHDLTSATQLYSTIPLPAYTSRDLIHFTPLIETWKDIFITTAKGVNKAEKYYSKLDLNDIAVIAAHEFTHHADFFHSEFEDLDEENMWFEEGMCFYLPRKLILSEEKQAEIMKVESKLIEKYKGDYGEYSLSYFGEAAVEHSDEFQYASAFYDYWRSTLVVETLIERYCQNNVGILINHYKEWVDGERKVNLQKHFIEVFNLSDEEAARMWLINRRPSVHNEQ